MSFSDKTFLKIKDVVINNRKKDETSLKETIDLFYEILSTNVKDEYNMHTMKLSITNFFDNDMRVKDWVLIERNRNDVLKFFGLMLYILNEKVWNELNTNKQLNELDKIYEGLNINIRKEVSDITGKDFLSWNNSYDTDEAYELIYRLFSLLDKGQEYDVGGPIGFYGMINCIFETYFALIHNNMSEIKAFYNDIEVEVFDYNAYFLKVKEHKIYDGISETTIEEFAKKYVPFSCECLDFGSKKDDCQTDKLYEILNDENSLILLLGIAGSGKTSTLLYLQYLIFNEIISGKSNVKVPVYLNVARIVQTEITEEDFYNKISEEIGTNNEALNKILINSQIQLFLDGLDETSSIVRKQIISYVGNMKGKIPIIIANRDTEKSDFRTLKPTTYSIKALSQEDVKKYYEKKATAEVQKYLLEDKMNDGTLNWIYEKNTNISAYKLEIILEVAKMCIANKKTFPNQDGLMESYIMYVFARELDKDGCDKNKIYLYRKVLKEFAYDDSYNIYDTLRGLFKRYYEGDNLMYEFEEFYEYIQRVPLVVRSQEDGTLKFVERAYSTYFTDKISSDGRPYNKDIDYIDGINIESIVGVCTDKNEEQNQ